MAPAAIPRVKEALRAVRAEDARALATECLGLATCAEIEARVRLALPALAGAALPRTGPPPQ
jgi:phosphoenolpyruvate-protein kinase (PTS system EI component)